MDRRQTLNALGIIRTSVGGAMLVAPAFSGRIWVGPDADGHGTRVFARAIGARDVALGASLLTVLRSGDVKAATALARLGVQADLADVVATMLAFRNLEGPRRWLMPIIAAAVAAGGVTVWASVAEGDRPYDPEQSTAARAGIVDQQDAVLEAIGANGG